MTKLYCPKGHELYTERRPFTLSQEDGDLVFHIWQVIGHCDECKRAYLDSDFKTKSKKEPPEFCFSEKKDCEHDLEEIIFTYDRPGGVPGFQKSYKCKKCGFIPKHDQMKCEKCNEEAEFLSILDFFDPIAGKQRHSETLICRNCRVNNEADADEVDAHEDAIAERHGRHYGYVSRPVYKEINK